MSFTKRPRIITFDIETSPILGYVWQAFDASLIHIVEDRFILSFAYQVYGQTKVYTKGLCDCKNPKVDKELVAELWKLFNEADILVGHNIDNFDIKIVNDRFMHWDMEPPAHYHTIDTLKLYKRAAKSTKNNLDYLCQRLQIDGKQQHHGKDLWISCINDRTKTKDWKKMLQYNAQDVRINTELYTKLRPWITNHPNIATFTNEKVCPNCGSHDLGSDGIRWAQGTKYRRLKCRGCGATAKQQILKDGSGGKISGR